MSPPRLLAIGLCLLAAVFAARDVCADERILDFHSEVAVAADGGVDVAETIKVRAEGDRIHHGIYREFPTDYRDSAGNAVHIDFHLLDSERDGNAEPSRIESESNGVRIYLGSPDINVEPGEHTWVIHYRANRELGFFDGHDELYWNATGVGWIFPIDHASVHVQLPQPVEAANLKAYAYTGRQGDRGTDWQAKVDGPGSASYETTAVLPSYNGLTVVLEFPEGMIAAPTASQRLGWMLADNASVLFGLAGLGLLLAWYLYVWNQLGRDPGPGVIIAQYDPPPGMSPAALRYVQKMGYDNRCFSADVVAMAVGGFLTIRRDSDSASKDSWSLSRPPQATNEPTDPAQRALGVGLLPTPGDGIELKNDNAQAISAARKAHEAALKESCQKRYFVTNNGTLLPGALLTAASGALVLLAGTKGGMALGIFLLVLMVVTNVVFMRLMKAQTPAGRKLLDAADGLKLYMSVADRDELHALQAPDAGRPTLDAGRYQSLLPFALALGVEEAWTNKFTLAVGAATAASAAASAGWYYGSGGMPMNFSDMSQSIGGSLDSAISSSSTPPGSSSGDGGSSGGGGGGGGGGGW